MNPVKAVLSWSLDTYCPHCGYPNDLADNDYDHIIAEAAIFGNQWDNLIDYEVTCIQCGKDFEIAGVEY